MRVLLGTDGSPDAVRAAALSRDPDPRYAATSPAPQTARPSILHVKRDTTECVGSP